MKMNHWLVLLIWGLESGPPKFEHFEPTEAGYTAAQQHVKRLRADNPGLDIQARIDTHIGNEHSVSISYGEYF
jgi:hypothetical protein